MIKDCVVEVRAELIRKLEAGEFVTDKTGVKCVEIINAAFIADEPTVFGSLNEDWSKRELEWYKSESLNVNDIPGQCPVIWKSVADKDGLINSNYGWCIWSEDNGNQYQHCINELIRNRDSRRATMIYIRPEMQVDYNKNGMSDFMCTYSAQLFIRNNKLDYCVYMRSADAIFGYKGDKFWHDHVWNESLKELRQHYPELELGTMFWNAGSFHVYSRHFNLITGE